MKLLLDTHAFLWLISNHRLSQRAVDAFLDPDNQPYLSAASYWEICIKRSVGKLDLAESWEQSFDREMIANDIRWLSIEKAHCQAVIQLPWIHRDPFDRLLIAQARCEGMSIVTTDVLFPQYGVKTIW